MCLDQLSALYDRVYIPDCWNPLTCRICRIAIYDIKLCIMYAYDRETDIIKNASEGARVRKREKSLIVAYR